MNRIEPKHFFSRTSYYPPKRVFANESFLRTPVFEQFVSSINQSRIFKSLVPLFGLCFNQCITQKSQEEIELKVLWSHGPYICCGFCTEVKILFLYTVLSIGGPHYVSGFAINFFYFFILLLLFPLYFIIWCFFLLNFDLKVKKENVLFFHTSVALRSNWGGKGELYACLVWSVLAAFRDRWKFAPIYGRLCVWVK